MMLTEVISSIGEAGLAAVTGYAVVFFGIILLMAVVSIMGKIMQATQKKAAPLPRCRPKMTPRPPSSPPRPVLPVS